jgi:hypothetical protein
MTPRQDAVRWSTNGPQDLRRTFLGALAVFGVLTTLWAFPIVDHLNSRILGGPSDATSTIRDYWSIEQQGGNPFTLKRDALISAPEGLSLAPGTAVANAVQPAFIWALKDEVGLVAAWNLFVLAGMALTGAMTFTLLTRLGVGRLAAAFGSYAFAFSGYLVDKAYAGHGGLVQAWVFPLLLLALIRADLRRTRLGAASAGFVCALAFYLHTYYGAFALFLVVLFFLYATARRRDEPLWPSLRPLGIALGTVLVLLLPALVAIRELNPATKASGSHPLDSLQQFGARIPAFFLPSTWSPLGHLIPSSLEAQLVNSGEPSLFFGYTTLILAAAWLVVIRKADVDIGRRWTTWFAALLVGTSFLFSLPREFAIGPVHVPAPSWFLGHFTTTLRVYARFGVLVGLGLVILAAFGLERLERARGRRWALACLVLLALELTPTLPAKAWVANDPPASDRWLARHPGGEVAIYPLAGDRKAAQRLNGEEYYFQRFHGHPVFSTVEASMPKQAIALRLVAQYFTASWTPHILAAEHVRYVVIRTDVYRELGEAPPVLSPKSFRLLAKVPDARIYRVLAAPLDVAAFFRGHGAELATAAGQQPPRDSFRKGFYPPENFKYNVLWRWLQQDGTINIRPTGGPTAMELHALAFSNGAPRTLQVYGPGHRLLGSAPIPTNLETITIGPFSIGPGTTTFTLHVTPGPQTLGPTDPRVASIYLSEPVFQPILRLHG